MAVGKHALGCNPPEGSRGPQVRQPSGGLPLDIQRPSDAKNSAQFAAPMRAVHRLAWAIFLLALPVTSFPFFPAAIGGEVLVRPLSLYPLLILTILVIVPRLVTSPIPRSLVSLIPFILVAITSSLISLLRGIEPAMGISAAARVLRGISTLAIGSSIYLAVTLLPDTIDDLRFSLRWIYAGCGLALFWGSLQAIYVVNFDPDWFETLSNAQHYISIRRLLVERVSGLTYEPHWFADQIVTLLIPGTLAAVLSGETVFRIRWRWLTIEWLLLGWSILVLPFTFSRSGLLNLLLLALLAMMFFRLIRRSPEHVTYKSDAAEQHSQRVLSEPCVVETPHRDPKPPSRLTQTIPSWPLRLPWKESLKVLVVLIVICVPIYLVGTYNNFFARIWEYWNKENTSLQEYVSYLGLDVRLAYAQAAINTYEAYPFLGVGLGNYAFYLEEMLPYRLLADIPEVLRMITPEKGRDRLVTAKNFYLRLLAETGILGAITFMAFVIAHLGCALYLWLSPDKEQRFWGMFSLLGLIAFALSAFSFDSFVIPNMWVVFGMISAATRVSLTKASDVSQQPRTPEITT